MELRLFLYLQFMNRPTIPGLDLPVHTIFCIGKNYEKHAKELGSTAPASPMIFLKPLTTLCTDGASVSIPGLSSNVHHEVELVIAISKTGKNIPREKALEYVAGYGIGIDFTARDLQSQAKKNGHPWALSKGFDHFAPIGPFTAYNGQDLTGLSLELYVNDELRQSGHSGDMIFDIPALITYLSEQFTLNPGDLIFTGTPEGVSAVKAGDAVKASLQSGQSTVNVTIV